VEGDGAASDTRALAQCGAAWNARRAEQSVPVQAMLNYAYAMLESQIRIAAVAAGFDPAIGFLHRERKRKPVLDVRSDIGSILAPERSALVLDLMEPLRPQVDRRVILFLRRHKFEPADIVVHPSGECRLHPQLARTLVADFDGFRFDLQVRPLLRPNRPASGPRGSAPIRQDGPRSAAQEGARCGRAAKDTRGPPQGDG
jgi:hypothetical protein